MIDLARVFRWLREKHRAWRLRKDINRALKELRDAREHRARMDRIRRRSGWGY